MIIGSGFATHNLREVFQHSGHDQSWTKTFPDWLTRTLTTLTGKERNEALEAWEKAPGARQAHPREEHLIPLMVSVGAAEHASGRLVFEESASSMCLNCYQFD
jgi:aromatic ring-opening dioxygenase catalytic subunit (LigB family)